MKLSLEQFVIGVVLFKCVETVDLARI
jgi:hypothetical protein